MTGVRTGGLVVVGVGLALQIGYAVAGVVPGIVPLVVVAAIALLAVCVAVNASMSVAAGWVSAVLLGASFGLAVADRFGVLGAPGESGVAWGDWDAFVAYTGQLMPFAPGWMVEISAAGATAAEIVLCVWLISGFLRRWAGLAAAALITVFLLSMLATVGLAAVVANIVVVQLGGALLVAVTPTRSIHPIAHARKP